MTYDLRSGLVALGREERDVAPDLPVDALTARAHRSRTLHAATYSAIGVGAAAVFTLGALAADGLWLDRDAAPVPPAIQSPTERPTQTSEARPTPSSTPSPTAEAFAPAWEMCGATFYDDSFYSPEEDGSFFWLSAGDGAAEAPPADAPVPLALTLYSEVDRDDVTVRLDDAFALVWNDDDFTATVVGVAAGPLGAENSGQISAEGGVTLPPATVPITSCEASPHAGGDGGLDHPLDPAGWYGLAVGAEVTTSDGTTRTVRSYLLGIGTEPEASDPSDEWTIREVQADGATAVPVDSPVRLTPVWSYADAAVSPDVEELCHTTSTPWPPEWLAMHGEMNGWREPPPTGMTNPFSVSATSFREGINVIVRVTTTNAGPAVNDAWIASPGVTVVKDGQIVGWRHMWNWAYAPETWGSGQTVQLEFDLGALTCRFMVEPWPAGTYEVYVQETMDLLPQAGYPERWRYGVVGGPFTITLD